MQNASWSINSLKVYSKQPLNGHLNGAPPRYSEHVAPTLLALGLAVLSWQFW